MISPPSKDREKAFALCPQLEQAAPKLEIYERLLREWQAKINLVSAATLEEVWTRHFADSAQLLEILPNAKVWVDLGSGAGFPGMVLALLLAERGGRAVLIESDRRKAAFLRAVSRETNAPVIVHDQRIETVAEKLSHQSDAVCARALAPLPKLVSWSKPLLMKNAAGAFLKGENWRQELTEAALESSLNFRSVQSRTNEAARVIVVSRAVEGGQELNGENRSQESTLD